MIPRNVIDRIKEQAIQADWNYAFGGKAKGNRHLSRVVSIAKFLADKEGASEEICEAGAWLHDIGLVDGNDDNPAKIRAYAESLLTDLPIDYGTRARIADCAETHEGTEEAIHIEAKIVHDADALDKMGMLGVIRHTWKIVNLLEPEASPVKVFSILEEHLAERQKKLYTTTAKKLVIVLNGSLHSFFADQVRAVELLAVIMHHAKGGSITEEIATMPHLKENNPVLIQQLGVDINEVILQEWYDQGEAINEIEQVILRPLPYREVISTL